MNSLTKQSKQTRSYSFRNKKLFLFLIGCAIGAACFVYIYGAKVIAPTYDAWLFNGDMDLRQHYIGWCHYRMSDWHFPIGLIDTLSYPTSVSVIYTDSIPLLAVFFKLFRTILPVHFQYFGLFGFISFCLQGGISTLLLYYFLSMEKTEVLFSAKSNSRVDAINNNCPEICSCIGAFFFVLSFTVLQRMFYHTALGAQWIILLALYVWFAGNTWKAKSRVIVYALLGVLAVFIHSYFLPMIGMILLAACVERLICRKKNDEDIKSELFHSITCIGLYCVLAIISLYILGGFYGSATGFGEGLGTFSSNINTFINPLDDSAILKALPLYNGFQYEGFGYVGLGIIIILVVLLAINISKLSDVKKILLSRYRLSIGLCVFLVGCMLAMFPIVTLGSKKIFGVPYPMFLRRILGIFRSNGRFIWIPMYLLMLGSVVGIYRLFADKLGNRDKGKSMLIKLIILLVLIQMVDVSHMISYKQDYFKKNQTYTSVWENSLIGKNGKEYREFVFLYNENDVIMDTGFFAYLNNMCMNNYYYARSYDKEVNMDIDQWKHELSNGIIDDKVVYVVKKEDLEEINGIVWYELDDEHMYGVKK